MPNQMGRRVRPDCLRLSVALGFIFIECLTDVETSECQYFKHFEE